MHGAINRDEFPSQISTKLPYYPIPVILIAQLAVVLTVQGRGLGGICVTSALNRIFRMNAELPSFAVIVDAIDDNARRFYERLNFQILDAKRTRTRMYMSMKTVSKLILEA